MKLRHKAWHCVSLPKAGLEFLASLILAWFIVTLFLGCGRLGAWSKEAMVNFSLLTVVIFVVGGTTGIKERRG